MSGLAIACVVVALAGLSVSSRPMGNGRAARRALGLLAVISLVLVAPLESSSSTLQTRVTIFARPTVVGWAQPATVFGAAAGAGLHDVVAVQVRECGSSAFRTYAEAHVNAGGGWTMPVGTSITSTFRAVWQRFQSAPVTIRQAANVGLARSRSGRELVVGVTAKRSFWRRQVEIQRRSGGAWRTVRKVRLTDSVNSTGIVSASEARFRLAVPKGTLLRAVLPLAEARPCYVRSVSRTVRA